jgi:hypothetical protein
MHRSPQLRRLPSCYCGSREAGTSNYQVNPTGETPAGYLHVGQISAAAVCVADEEMTMVYDWRTPKCGR